VHNENPKEQMNFDNTSVELQMGVPLNQTPDTLKKNVENAAKKID
jgi:hypothetical protein